MAILGYCHEQRCIVMEFLPHNLYDFIHEQTEPIAPDLLLQIASDIVRGIKYLHSQRIIHRDLKSSNLLLDKHLNVKVGDLGISRVVSLTNTMTTIGTIAWTAPGIYFLLSLPFTLLPPCSFLRDFFPVPHTSFSEILRHEPYDERADIYSFSIVLFELCTRRIPYEDELKNPMEIGRNYLLLRPLLFSTLDHCSLRVLLHLLLSLFYRFDLLSHSSFLPSPSSSSYSFSRCFGCKSKFAKTDD